MSGVRVIARLDIKEPNLINGIIPGRVEAIPKTTIDGKPHKIPQIGWAGLEGGRRASRMARVNPEKIKTRRCVIFRAFFRCSNG